MITPNPTGGSIITLSQSEQGLLVQSLFASRKKVTQTVELEIKHTQPPSGAQQLLSFIESLLINLGVLT